ncbi:MAG: YlbF family regulator [Bacillota bacterium]
MSLSERIKDLANAVKDTREFNDLKNAKKGIDSNRELRQKVEDFKRREEELFSLRKSGRDTRSVEEDLNNLFNSLSKIPEINKFLKAEKDFNNMMAKVYKGVNEFVDAHLK